MTTPISSFQEEQSLKFFNEINRHLGMRSRHKLVKLVRVVLSNVRRSLSEDQAALVGKRLPRLFRRLFAGNKKSGEKQLSIQHLDELVDSYIHGRQEVSSPRRCLRRKSTRLMQ